MALSKYKNFFFTYILKNILIFYPKTLIFSVIDLYGIDKIFFFFNSLNKFFTFISKSSLFRLKSCLENTIIDFLKKKTRFCIYYILMSKSLFKKYMFWSSIKENERIFSLNKIYPSVMWLEREIYEMFGIFFLFHNNLKKLLLDYGFNGHPLKKNFPVFGFKELYYSNFYHKIKYVKT